MKMFIAFLLIVTSALTHAQPPNYILRSQRNSAGTANFIYNHPPCSANGLMVWRIAAVQENCINLSANLAINDGVSPPEIAVVGLNDLTADFATAQSDITTLLGIVADLESAMATIQDAVATLSSDLNTLSAEVDGKFDIPTGLDTECVRGDGSVGACPP